MKNEDKNNYNNSNKTEVKKLTNVRGQCLYSRAKYIILNVLFFT